MQKGNRNLVPQKVCFSLKLKFNSNISPVSTSLFINHKPNFAYLDNKENRESTPISENQDQPAKRAKFCLQNPRIDELNCLNSKMERLGSPAAGQFFDDGGDNIVGFQPASYDNFSPKNQKSNRKPLTEIVTPKKSANASHNFKMKPQLVRR